MLVIGSGPAGQRAAIQGAKFGKHVALVEQRAVLGGVTAHTGTIPSKTLREAVLYLSGWRQRGFYGHGYRVKERITADDLVYRLDKTVQHQIDVVQNQLQRNGVTVFEGTASFCDSTTIKVSNGNGSAAHYGADRIIIATGTTPHRPTDIAFDDGKVIDSDGILDLREIPRRMTVIGAGVIGVEYATIFSALDVKVTLVDARRSILDFVERDLVDEIVHDMRDRGIVLRLGEKVSHVECQPDGSTLTHLESGKRVAGDVVLVAAGRQGATHKLELDNAGVGADERGRVRVNDLYQTSVDHIYAVGDVIGFPALASTSAEQGRLAACHAFSLNAHSSPEHFPFGIYAVPEISTVGMTEDKLREEDIPYETGVARLRETARGQILGMRKGLLKMLFSLEDRRLLGVHIVGEGATELIHIGQAVLALGGTLDYFLEAVFNYPTLAESYKIAALDAYNRMGC